MNKSSNVKIAVIGVGQMGSLHVRDIHELENTELIAICDIDRSRADRYAQQYNVPAFYNHREMLAAVHPEAVLVATPHYDHPAISMGAFEHGIHVLTEKPIAVHVKAAKEAIAAYQQAKKKYPDLVYAAMFQQRTYGFWQKIKSLIDEGELGRLVRATWIITDWFRTQNYYDHGGWRATWKGEGGGVLLNQCPHNLDLYQWFVGMPQRVTGFASIGKYHHIEVEDEVTSYLEYKTGMIGHIITSTAESPGTNRLEIVGERGKLIFENEKITFFHNRYSMFEQIEKSRSGFQHVENWVIDIPFKHHGETGHRLVTENFANAILHQEALIAPAVEGIHSLTLGNAIMLSSLLSHPVEIPFDDEKYAAKLQELIENSHVEKIASQGEITDFSNLF